MTYKLGFRFTSEIYLMYGIFFQESAANIPQMTEGQKARMPPHSLFVR